MTHEEKIRIQISFRDRMITQDVKWQSKEYFKRQLEFFCGAMAAKEYEPQSWLICIMSSRPIVQY